MGTAATSVAVYPFGGVIERVFAHATGTGSFACYLLGTALARDSVCWSSGGGVGLYVQAGGAGGHAPTARNVTAFATGTGGIGIKLDSELRHAPLAQRPEHDRARSGRRCGGGDRFRDGRDGDADDGEFRLRHPVETGTGATVTDPGTGNNVTGAPLFVNAGAGDFHEKVGSPTINAGSAAGQLGQFDIDGQARVQGSAPDIGADEFDQIAPQTRITKGPKAKTRKRTATFKFSSSEAAALLPVQARQQEIRALLLQEDLSEPEAGQAHLQRASEGRHKEPRQEPGQAQLDGSAVNPLAT